MVLIGAFIRREIEVKVCKVDPHDIRRQFIRLSGSGFRDVCIDHFSVFVYSLSHIAPDVLVCPAVGDSLIRVLSRKGLQNCRDAAPGSKELQGIIILTQFHTGIRIPFGSPIFITPLVPGGGTVLLNILIRLFPKRPFLRMFFLESLRAGFVTSYKPAICVKAVGCPGSGFNV